jgi:hypothetical protein
MVSKTFFNGKVAWEKGRKRKAKETLDQRTCILHSRNLLHEKEEK